jgi:hypothetical protein
MTTQNYYESVSETIYLSTNEKFTYCDLCKSQLSAIANIGDAINHYLKYHRTKLLHVGQESSIDGSGKQFSSTVAILGRSV